MILTGVAKIFAWASRVKSALLRTALPMSPHGNDTFISHVCAWEPGSRRFPREHTSKMNYWFWQVIKVRMKPPAPRSQEGKEPGDALPPSHILNVCQTPNVQNRPIHFITTVYASCRFGEPTRDHLSWRVTAFSPTFAHFFLHFYYRLWLKMAFFILRKSMNEDFTEIWSDNNKIR